MGAEADTWHRERTAHKIYNVFQEQQAVRLNQNKKPCRSYSCQGKRRLESTTGVFSTNAGSGNFVSRMLEIVHLNFYREVLRNTYENAPQREADLQSLLEFAGNYPDLDSFLNELSLVGNSLVRPRINGMGRPGTLDPDHDSPG